MVIGNRSSVPLHRRGPLRVMFVITSMPVGGAETLLVNLVRRLDRQRFSPQVCCLKQRDALGETLANEIQVHDQLIRGKYDFRVLRRLARLFRQQQIDAVVTVGAGDKMFWGRLAARCAGVPVIASALHSTGWPDGVGRLNRMLTPITDAFIAVAHEHGRYLAECERFPARKVRVIPNGIDTDRFQFDSQARQALRHQLGISQDAPVCGTVAALRPEKNHLLFLRTAAQVKHQLDTAQFVLVGDGPEREKLEIAARGSVLEGAIHFLGSRDDVPQVMSTFDLFALTSHNEASPVSILEAMSVGLPVVSTDVGSVRESVEPGVTGQVAPPGDAAQLAQYWLELLSDRSLGRQMGRAGRQHVISHASLDSMVCGYQNLLSELYSARSARQRWSLRWRRAAHIPS